MTHGLVIGKFYPFHRGHAHLIETARTMTVRVTVAVCDRSDQVILAEERARWILESFPDVDVVTVPDIGHDDDSELWARYTIHALGFRPDAVFTSEGYGDAYARFLGARHISVDPSRKTVPVSGTAIRRDMERHWEYLMPRAKARFAKRVAIVGPESTGKSTLARRLAEHFETVWVPEYGRVFSEGKHVSDDIWETREFELIADAQNRLEDGLARSANRVLICDTNSWATGIWHERYMGFSSDAVKRYAEGRKYDLVLLTAPDVPFVDDGLRDGEHIREAMFRRFREALDVDRIPYTILEGDDYGMRIGRAVRMVGRVIRRERYALPEFPSATRRIGDADASCPFDNRIRGSSMKKTESLWHTRKKTRGDFTSRWIRSCSR